MASALGKEPFSRFDIGIGLLEAEPCLPVSQRTINALSCPLKKTLLAPTGMAMKKIDRILLALGPEAFRGDISPQALFASSEPRSELSYCPRKPAILNAQSGFCA